MPAGYYGRNYVRLSGSGELLDDRWAAGGVNEASALLMGAQRGDQPFERGRVSREGRQAINDRQHLKPVEQFLTARALPMGSRIRFTTVTDSAGLGMHPRSNASTACWVAQSTSSSCPLARSWMPCSVTCRVRRRKSRSLTSPASSTLWGSKWSIGG